MLASAIRHSCNNQLTQRFIASMKLCSSVLTGVSLNRASLRSPWIIILSHVQYKIVDRAIIPLRLRTMPVAAMIATTLTTGTVRGVPASQVKQKHVQLSRLSTCNPSAFSSDRISTSRKAQSRRQRQTRCARRQSTVVLAAAATDVASSTVQAIKKTIGGDIFVAGATLQAGDVIPHSDKHARLSSHHRR